MNRDGLEKRARKRLLEGVRKDEAGCWNWTRYLDPCGYGRMRFGGIPTSAHRVAYQLFVGQIPDGLTIDHLCRNRACVNPEHLEAVTAAENSRRAIWERFDPSRCSRGHDRTPENTYIAPNGARACRPCGRVRRAKSTERRKALVAATTTPRETDEMPEEGDQ